MNPARLTAVIWLLGATVYLACEGISAARVDGYSYVSDFISDLGVVPLMNIGAFMVHGMLFAAGAFVIGRGWLQRSRVAQLFVAAAVANAVGNVLVGTFPSGSAQAHWHVVGAGLAIVGGNVAVIAGGVGSQALGAHRALGWAGIALGSLGIASLLVLIADGSRVVPPGLVERASVYPIIAWELLAGAAFLVRGTDTRRG